MRRAAVTAFFLSCIVCAPLGSGGASRGNPPCRAWISSCNTVNGWAKPVPPKVIASAMFSEMKTIALRMGKWAQQSTRTLVEDIPKQMNGAAKRRLTLHFPLKQNRALVLAAPAPCLATPRLYLPQCACQSACPPHLYGTARYRPPSGLPRSPLPPVGLPGV